MVQTRSQTKAKAGNVPTVSATRKPVTQNITPRVTDKIPVTTNLDTTPNTQMLLQGSG